MKQIIKKSLCTLMAAGILMTSSLTTLAATAGDVNADGKINATDALMILKHSVGKTTEGFDKSAADVNSDGKVNASDALLVLKITVGADNSSELSKEEIVKLYNNSIKTPHTQDKCVYQTSFKNTNTLNKVLVDGKEDPEITERYEKELNDPINQHREYTFYKGKTANNEKSEDIIKLKEYEPDQIKSATAVKHGDGYRITLVLDLGTDKDGVSVKDWEDKDNFNHGMLTPDNHSIIYLRNEVIAITDADGRIVSLDSNMFENVKSISDTPEEESQIFLDMDVEMSVKHLFTY